MAVDKSSKKNTYSPHKGIPSNDGKSKAETKEIGENNEELENKDELRNKYTKDTDEPVDDLLENPNRNRNKVGIDNNKYN